MRGAHFCTGAAPRSLSQHKSLKAAIVRGSCMIEMGDKRECLIDRSLTALASDRVIRHLQTLLIFPQSRSWVFVLQLHSHSRTERTRGFSFDRGRRGS